MRQDTLEQRRRTASNESDGNVSARDLRPQERQVRTIPDTRPQVAQPSREERRTFADRNRRAREVYDRWEKPTLLRFGKNDFILGAAGPGFLKWLKALRGQEMVWVERAGHFVQEDAGPELAADILEFMAR